VGIKLTTLVVIGTDFIGNLISNYHSDLTHVKCNFPHFIYKTKYDARLGNDFIGNLISDYHSDLSHDNVLQNAISLLFLQDQNMRLSC
jgi:hypothetical protein